MVYVENELIGKRLQKIRKDAHMEYYDMAKLLGVSEGHYRKIERGIYGLDIPKLMTLYTELGVDPLYLLAGRQKSPVSRERPPKEGTREYVCELLDYCKRQIGRGVEV